MKYRSIIFIESATPPTTPVTGSFDGTTEIYPNGWKPDPQQQDPKNPIWFSVATYTDVGNTLWDKSFWSTPIMLTGMEGYTPVKGKDYNDGSIGSQGNSGQGGSQGERGYSAPVTVYVYKKTLITDDTPSTPFGGTYDPESTPELSAPVGWSTDVLPTTEDEVLWFSRNIYKEAEAGNWTGKLWSAPSMVSGAALLNSNTQQILDQLDRDIRDAEAANQATNTALSLTRASVDKSFSALDSTLAAVSSTILREVDFQEALLGYYSQVNYVNEQTQVNSTNITQKADYIELQAVKAELQGEINRLEFGVEGNLQIGELEGQMTEVRFFIGESQLDGTMTIGSYLNDVLLTKDYASITYVQSEITALGIENFVTNAYLDNQLVSINSQLEFLGSNTFKRGIVSFATESANSGTIAEKLLVTEAQLILNQVDTENFKGSLAATNEEIAANADLTSAEVTALYDQIARIDGDTALIRKSMVTRINEEQKLARKTEQLEVQDEENLVTAIDYTRTAIGVCIDSNGNITSEENAEQCELDGGTWVSSAALAETIKRTELTITNPDGSTTTANAQSLLQVLKSDTGELKARAFMGTDVDGRVTGLVIEDESGNEEYSGTISVLSSKMQFVHDFNNDPQNPNYQITAYFDTSDPLNPTWVYPNGVTISASQEEQITANATSPGNATIVDNLFNGSNFDTRAAVHFSVSGDLGRLPKHGDTLTLSNGSDKVQTKTYSVNTWTDPLVLFNGSVVVSQSLSADKLIVNELLATTIKSTFANFSKLTVNEITLSAEDVNADPSGSAATAESNAINTAATNANNAAKTAGSVGGWKLNSTTIFSGNASDVVTSGYRSVAGINLNNVGSIHSKEFYLNSDGSAGFKGNMSAASGNFSTASSQTELRINPKLADGSLTNFPLWYGLKTYSFEDKTDKQIRENALYYLDLFGNRTKDLSTKANNYSSTSITTNLFTLNITGLFIIDIDSDMEHEAKFYLDIDTGVKVGTDANKTGTLTFTVKFYHNDGAAASSTQVFTLDYSGKQWIVNPQLGEYNSQTKLQSNFELVYDYDLGSNDLFINKNPKITVDIDDSGGLLAYANTKEEIKIKYRVYNYLS